MRNKKKNKKLRKISLASLIFLSSVSQIVISNPISSYADETNSNNKIKTVSFPYSSDRNPSQTITIPKLNNVISVTTDNGKVSYSRNENTLTVNASEGEGKEFQTGGVYIPADTKMVDGQTSDYYNKDGYSGYLTKYVYSGSYSPKQDKTVSQIEEYPLETSAPMSIFYNSGGFSGTLSKQSVVRTQRQQQMSGGVCSMTNDELEKNANEFTYLFTSSYFGQGFTDAYASDMYWTSDIQPYNQACGNGQVYPWVRWLSGKVNYTAFVATYVGNVTKPESDTRVYRYKGEVTKPAVDTRTWETRYSYNVTIEYTEKPYAPTITLNPSNENWGNTDVIVTITDNEDSKLSGFKVEYKLTGDSVQEWTEYTSPINISKEGITKIEARVIDNNGTISDIKTSQVKIDKTSPVISYKIDSSEWKNDMNTIHISASDNASGVKRIQLPNGNWVTNDTVSFDVVENGDYLFIVEDEAGNRTEQSITVGNIDKEKPTIDLSLNTTDWTNEDVIIHVISEDNQSGVNRIQLPDGNWIATKETFYRVTQNGIYEFIVEDKAGNRVTEKIGISNIDKIPPRKPVIHASTTNWSKDLVSFTIDGSIDESGILKYQYQVNNGEWKDYKDRVTLSDEGTISIKARAIDLAGNISEEESISLYLDTTQPHLTIEKDISEWTNKGVTLTAIAGDELSGMDKIQLPNGTWVTGSTASQKVLKNGSYTFKAVDKAGNEFSKTIVVDNIDTTPPTISLTPNITSYTNQSVLIDVVGLDDESQVKRIQLPNGNWIMGNRTTYEVSTNGTYNFVVEDEAGNQTKKSISITNIDDVAPTPPTISNSQEWTKNSPVSVTITPGRDSQSGVKSVEYKLEGATLQGWTTYNGAIKISNEGETKITARTVDKVGNWSEEVTSYARIDKSSPYNLGITIKLKPYTIKP